MITNAISGRICPLSEHGLLVSCPVGGGTEGRGEGSGKRNSLAEGETSPFTDPATRPEDYKLEIAARMKGSSKRSTGAEPGIGAPAIGVATGVAAIGPDPAAGVPAP